MSEHPGPSASKATDAPSLGLNAWFAEEIYQSYLVNPASVDEGWRKYFAENGRPNTKRQPVYAPVGANGSNGGTNGYVAANAMNGVLPGAPVAMPQQRSLGPAREAQEEAAGETLETVTPLRGAQGRIVTNMVASLSVPTATSVHPLPAKLLEVNRQILNRALAGSGRKTSFTHLIAYAIVRALGKVPAMNASFVDDADGKGTPGVLRHAHVGLGIAIDLERPGGNRSLVVPAIKAADTLDFSSFVAAYEELVQKARSGSLSVDDFSGVTITLTNPGTLGTTQSVPRLMAGQGAIIGVGALDYPPEYGATDPARLAELGIGKVVTLTSTYDHRIIQGAESGLFLKHVHELLVGADGFYDEVFAALGVADAPARWGRDRSVPPEQVRSVAIEKEREVHDLIEAYRRRGHLLAHLDPLELQPIPEVPDLEASSYGLTVWDYDREFSCSGLGGNESAPLSSIIEMLKATYCGTVAVEYEHIEDPDERAFVRRLFEAEAPELDAEERRHVLERLTASDSFERFLHARYVGQKRFGLEGGDAAIVFLDTVLAELARGGTAETVLGMAHRGRLNALANIVGKPYGEIFADFEGNLDPTTVAGSGDVKYHKGASGKWVGQDGISVNVTMAPNPSHLEAVNPVVEGMTRAKREHAAGLSEDPAAAILVHGDASFAAQGVVAETLNLSTLEGYRTGGTIHLVINNQVGFTTSPSSARSTRYATDVAKAVEAPIFHVNGDDPEAVVRVAKLCSAYRAAFHKDVVCDLVCYRLHGHNEGDDPSYTQPLMYKAIEAHKPVRDAYAERLVTAGLLDAQQAEEMRTQYVARLQAELEQTRAVEAPHHHAVPRRPRVDLPSLEARTGVDRDVLDKIAARLHSAPSGFVVHPKLERQLRSRAELYANGDVDWALGEALAYGSLLVEGTDVRLTGQDTRRGTFSHRHAVLIDYDSGAEYTPLASLGAEVDGAPAVATSAGTFAVRDSLLSEYAALGFEYGFSVEDKDALVLWEAQFGDFANGAQIIIDNFIVAGEEKWGQSSGLVLLLPHGYEGQGPEHSSARIERYLTLAVDGNITVAQPTTAAQFFHLLRAQARRTLRRPLVVIAPKSILRAREARSPIEELVSGGFHEVLDDQSLGIEAPAVRRIVLCSGKVAFEAMERRAKLDAPVAVVRLEQLAPYPQRALEAISQRYSEASEVVYLQDEPENMGAWRFLSDPLRASFAGKRVGVVARQAAGSPATGSHHVHDLEVDDLLNRSIGELSD